jgi:hypothetical protein
MSMERIQKQGWIFGILGIGIAIGVWAANRPTDEIPIQALGTDRSGDYVLTTGFVDEGVEAVYFLDYLTGTLSAGVLSKHTRSFRSMYYANVTQNLTEYVAAQGGAVPQKPNYLITTGMNDIMLTGGSNTDQPSLSAIYVLETNTGILLTYVIPWNRSAHAGGHTEERFIQPWTAQQFRAADIRE